MDKKIDFIKEQLDTLFKQFHAAPLVSVEPIEDVIKLEVTGDDLSFLIGYRGRTLDSLQHFLGNALFTEFQNWTPVHVDINDYRKQREEKIEEIVKNIIDRVRFLKEAVEMEPMSSAERFFIHTYVSDYPDITSASIGERADRRVVLSPTGSSEE